MTAPTMKPDLEQAVEIAAGLSEAQRRYLLQATRPRWALGDGSPALYTYPPPNTHSALMRAGLVDEGGKVRALGLRVRTILEKGNDRGE